MSTKIVHDKNVAAMISRTSITETSPRKGSVQGSPVSFVSVQFVSVPVQFVFVPVQFVFVSVQFAVSLYGTT